MQISRPLFEKSNIESDRYAQHNHTAQHASDHFDDNIDRLLVIAKDLMLNKGVFHISIHFSSSELVCWTFDNPYSYQVYTAEEVFSTNFMNLFLPVKSNIHTCINKNKILPILDSLKILRDRQNGSELRNASIHMINGYIGLTFACDDTRYINFKDFIMPLENESSLWSSNT